jgi:hypothetical protein
MFKYRTAKLPMMFSFAVLWLKELAFGLSKAIFEARPVHVGSVVYKVAI